MVHDTNLLSCLISAVTIPTSYYLAICLSVVLAWLQLTKQIIYFGLHATFFPSQTRQSRESGLAPMNHRNCVQQSIIRAAELSLWQLGDN